MPFFCTILFFLEVHMDNIQYGSYREQKKHTPDDFPYNTYLCTIPLDFASVKIHWHEEVELIIVKKGEGKISVDLEEYDVKAGDIVFVPSGKLHSIGQKDGMSMEYENIIFKSSLLYSEGEDLCRKSYIDPICGGEIPTAAHIHGRLSCHGSISELVSRMDRLCGERKRGYQLAVKGCLFQIMYLLLTEGGAEERCKTNERSLTKLKIILSYIEKNYHKQITVEEISGCCFYSKSYFMRFFKETMGISFVEYLNNYRLDAAAKMLLSSGENILNIASECGFDNLSYFNRRFKKRFDMTPGEYRRIGRYRTIGK